MKLKHRSLAHSRWGYADYFNDRQKLKALELAEIKSSDILFDMGCGDTSFLIFAVKEYGLKAVGFENMSKRFSIACKKIKKEKLQNKITMKEDHV